MMVLPLMRHISFNSISSLVLLVSLGFPGLIPAGPLISLTDKEKRQIENGEIIVRNVSDKNVNGQTYEAVGIMKASASDIHDLLTNYDLYPEFMPNISKVEIIKQNHIYSHLNYTLSLPLGHTKRYRLELKTTVIDDQILKLSWHLIDWPNLESEETIKDTTGYWLIMGIGSNQSYVLYHVYTDPGAVPFGFGWMVKRMSKESLPEAFENTRQRVEKGRNRR